MGSLQNRSIGVRYKIAALGYVYMFRKQICVLINTVKSECRWDCVPRDSDSSMHPHVGLGSISGLCQVLEVHIKSVRRRIRIKIILGIRIAHKTCFACK